MSAMVSQITGVSTVYSTVFSRADQRRHQSSVSLAFVKGIHRWPSNSPHNGPVTRKMFPFDDVIMKKVVYARNHFLKYRPFVRWSFHAMLMIHILYIWLIYIYRLKSNILHKFSKVISCKAFVLFWIYNTIIYMMVLLSACLIFGVIQLYIKLPSWSVTRYI